MKLHLQQSGLLSLKSCSFLMLILYKSAFPSMSEQWGYLLQDVS